MERRRTSLGTLRGGPIRSDGDPAFAPRLRHAMDVRADDRAADDYTHGFHSYPARFHPVLVRRLLEGARGARVLDPFVGSGTTLVEAAVAGCAGVGSDLNPLAVAISRLKATPLAAPRRALLLDAARRVAEVALAEVRDARRSAGRARRAPPSAATRFDDPKLYPPHVYRELVTLRLAIDDVAAGDAELRGALLLLLSSILVKVSLQRSDTDESTTLRAIARGAPTRHFLRRAEELAARLARFGAAVPKGTPPVDVRVADARRLTHVADGSVDLVITSPPYLGTYDYTRHHLRRLGWLGIDPGALEAGELGARRGAADPAAAFAAWRRDVAAYAGELGRALRPGGVAYVLVGDSLVAGAVVIGYDELARAAPGAKLTLVARASQQRAGQGPDGRPDPRRPPRSEHLLALRRS